MTGVRRLGKKRSYDDLLRAYEKLEAESGQHLIMQRDLNRAKDQIDDELMRFKAIQTYIANTLTAATEDEFFALTLEALIEAFELEVALFLQGGSNPGQVRVSAVFGIDDPPQTLPLALGDLTADQSLILDHDHGLLKAWARLDLHQAILCPLTDQTAPPSGAVVMGITGESMHYYKPIGPDVVSAFTVMVQQAGALWNNRQLTTEIISKNQKLVHETGQLLIMQRDLTNAKDQIDDELMRFKSIQSYIAKALDTEAEPDFFDVTLESVVEAFEFEVALFVTFDQDAGHLDVVHQFGFDELPPNLVYDKSWFESGEAQIATAESEILTAWESLQLNQIIYSPFVNKSGAFAGTIIAGVTRDSADYFDPISPDQASAYSVMVQQAGALWMTRQMSDEIRRHNTQLVNLTKSYSRFVPFEFLDLLEKKSIQDIEAGASASIDMGVLFLDIRGFTALTEKLGPADTFTWLNTFLREMEPIIAEQKGFINQFQGDAILALFPGAADAALNCASQMITQTKVFNEDQKRLGNMQIKFGLGINSGSVMLGAIGGANRLESNIVGDTANLASRTEGLTKHYGVEAIFTEYTRDRIKKPDGFVFRELDRVTVKGRLGAVTIYQLLAPESPTNKTPTKSLAAFKLGRTLYQSGQFAEALEAFQEAQNLTPNDNAARLYVERCRALKSAPPPDWNGITAIDEK